MAPLYLSQSKKKARAQGAALIHGDEASFRQDSTLHATWARRGVQPQVPVTGQRRSVKVFACVEIHSARFLYRRDSVFNAETYLDFLEQVARHYYPRAGDIVTAVMEMLDRGPVPVPPPDGPLDVPDPGFTGPF